MRLRRGWPLAVFAVLVVVLPIFEVWLLIQVGQQIGVWPTLAILVVEAVVGGWLMRREGGRAWQALIGTFGAGRVPTGQLADAVLVLCGGLLLMLPGFATDVIGFLFLLPMTRPAARRILAFFIARRLQRMSAAAQGRSPATGGMVIEGEAVDVPPPPSPVVTGEVTDR